MINSYASGFYQGVLTIFNILERTDIDNFIKSKKQYKTFIKSLLKVILEDSYVRDDFIKYRDYFKYHRNLYYIDKDTKEFKVKREQNNGTKH